MNSVNFENDNSLRNTVGSSNESIGLEKESGQNDTFVQDSSQLKEIGNKGKKRSFLLLLIGLFLVFLFLQRGINSFNKSRVSEGNKLTKESFVSQNGSIGNNIEEKAEVEQVKVPEVDMLLSALVYLSGTGWSGNIREELPIGIDNLGKGRLEEYLRWEEEGDAKLLIPNNEIGYFLGERAQQNITRVLKEARRQFLDYLLEKQVNKIYIDEIEREVLPPERIFYYSKNDPNSDFTRTEAVILEDKLTKDYRKLAMHVYPVDIYNRVRILKRTGIWQEQEELVEAAAKFLVFHEMTHVLQQAYVNKHLPADKNKPSIKSLWRWADKTLVGVSSKHFWDWGGGAMKDSNNKTIADESQAEGVAWLVLASVYNLNEQQASSVWKHAYGRLTKLRGQLEEIRKLSSSYPRFSPEDMAEPLAKVVEKYPDPSKARKLGMIARRIISLPAYVGYANPMQPEESNLLWRALRD